MPKTQINEKQIAQEILDKSQGGKNTNILVDEVCRMAKVCNDLGESKKIEAILENLKQTISGNQTAEAQVITPISLIKGQTDAIKATLKKRFGKDFSLREIVDEKLGGGIKIIYNDFVLDLTTESSIKKLFN